MKRLFLSLVLILQFHCIASAQHVLGITLVVNGAGATKEEAISNALRSAIEQTYGTFISSNTAILNDELIKDEIVSVSSGNIENYEEISHSVADNNHTVNLQVTVSISKLTSFAKSKGSSAELAGNTFAMNMKLRKLNKDNEKIALENLLQQVEIMSKEMFDFEMIIGEPRVAGKDGILYELLCNKFSNEYDFRFAYNENGEWRKATHTGYYIPITVRVKTNKNTKLVFSTIANTLSSLSLNWEERRYYKQHSIPYFTLVCTPTHNLKRGYMSNYYNQKGVKPTTYYLRSFEYLENFISELVRIINHASYGYTIVADNNPKLSYTLATYGEHKPQNVLTDNLNTYHPYFGKYQVFVHSAFYNNWVGENEQTVNVVRIAEAERANEQNSDKKFDYGYDINMLGMEDTIIKSDNITLYIKESEMLELTGLQLIP